jgi:cytochrome c heme-lyase
MGLQQSKEPAAQMPPCSAGQEAFRANNATQASNCPVPEEVRRPVYNVYNQRIDDSGGASSSAPAAEGSPMMDPKNNMPLVPNQQPFPGQRKLLSTARQDSTIPKGGTESTWTYPSPQMFYNGTSFVQCRHRIHVT